MSKKLIIIIAIIVVVVVLAVVLGTAILKDKPAEDNKGVLVEENKENLTGNVEEL